jgi:2-oxoglutarate ferredoxin oxidoreductase subunit gamma
MRKELRVVGFGGQGIILSGYIIGKAAAVFDKKYASLIQAYGPEARGSACHASVVIDDQEIDYPQVTDPDILAIMSQEGYSKFSRNLKKGGIMLIDSGLVKIAEGAAGPRLYRIPATALAEKAGRKIVANMVMLGFLTQKTGVVSTDAMENAIKTSVPKGTADLNLKAYRLGLEHDDPGAGS